MISNICLRNAKEKDCLLIWKLSNDVEVRAASFSSDEIAWESHQQWFNNKLRDSNCLFLIVESLRGEFLGQIRFELKNEDWIISLSFLTLFRGQGFGGEALEQSSELFFKQYPKIDKISAYIKNTNKPSIHIFEKKGYLKARNATINSKNDAIHMILNRSNIK